mgnify:CR=1 FL=1
MNVLVLQYSHQQVVHTARILTTFIFINMINPLVMPIVEKLVRYINKILTSTRLNQSFSFKWCHRNPWGIDGVQQFLNTVVQVGTWAKYIHNKHSLHCKMAWENGQCLNTSIGIHVRWFKSWITHTLGSIIQVMRFLRSFTFTAVYFVRVTADFMALRITALFVAAPSTLIYST